MKQWSITTRFVTLQNVRIGQFRSHCAGWTHLRGLRRTPSTLGLFWTKAVQVQTIVFAIENNRIQLRKDQWCVWCMRGFSWIKRTIIQRSWCATIHRPFCAAARFTNNDWHIDTVANTYRKLRLRFLLHWHKDTFLSSYLFWKGVSGVW